MKQIIKKIFYKVLSKIITREFLNKYYYEPLKIPLINILEDYGYFQSIKYALPVNKLLAPIPWYTYPAIEYIKQLDLKDKCVFEWGCGNSSLFFANRSKEVISVEDNLIWYDKINMQKPDNLFLFHSENEEYVNIISRFNKKFDIIIIDANHRYECAKIALDYLVEGGLIILDNSDWFKNSAGIIRQKGMIQVDFHGFGPINKYSWITSLFFSRDFKFNPTSDNQPEFTIGGLTHVCD
jgi:hypothetical protein